MTQTERNHHGKHASWWQLYLHGLDVSVRGNAQAFGFSILITVSYGIVSTSTDKPSSLELVGFALSAVAAFTLLNMLIAYRKSLQADEVEKTSIMLVATATDFLSVSAGLGVVFAATALFHDWVPWIVSPFLMGLAYGLVQALQIAFTRHRADENDSQSS